MFGCLNSYRYGYSKDISKDKTPSFKVMGRRSAIKSLTGTFFSIDVPQSPLNIFFKKVKYCTYRGWSKPSLFLTFSYTSGVTLGPTIRSTGSPGARCNIKNTISVKPISNGIISNSFFIIYFANLSPQFPTS